ncbi:MAG: hypothetical protein NT067_04070 [Candidatus Diapherotrites archaeon]|nr:hypothetical protein [Candidatus Diapherotrites archaeon]
MIVFGGKKMGKEFIRAIIKLHEAGLNEDQILEVVHSFKPEWKGKGKECCKHKKGKSKK